MPGTPRRLLGLCCLAASAVCMVSCAAQPDLSRPGSMSKPPADASSEVPVTGNSPEGRPTSPVGPTSGRSQRLYGPELDMAALEAEVSQLALAGCMITSDECRQLCSIPLEVLELAFCSFDSVETFCTLVSLPTLRILRISGLYYNHEIPINDVDGPLDDFIAPPVLSLRMERVEVSFARGRIWMLLKQAIEEGPDLEGLTLDSVGMRVEEPLRISGSKLTRLGLKGMPAVTDGYLRRYVASCSGLEWLDLSNCSRITPAAIADCLRANPKLRNVSLSRTAIDSGIVPILTGLRDLNSLDVGHTTLNERDLAALFSAPELRVLHAAMTRFNHETIRAAGDAMTKVDALYLNWCENMTDSAADALAELTNIKILDLLGCHRLSDECKKRITARFSGRTLYVDS